jgi:Triose-phosphate Transporter family
LDRIGISLTYTSKCGIPLITVLLTVLLDGWNSLPSSLALLSLLPIGIGIGAASWNSPTFKLGGFLAALGSTTCQSLLNVCSKRAFSKTGISGVTAQRSMAAVGLVLSVVLTGFQLISKSQQYVNYTKTRSHRQPAIQQEKSNKRPIWIPVSAAIAYHVEYVLSFTFVSLVNPISYGTCDAIRRLSTILVGRAMFGGAPLTRVNILGVALALSGALMYSIVS